MRFLFQGPGEGPNAELYSGALLPEVTRTVTRPSVRSGADVPRFGRLTVARPRSGYSLAWSALSLDEGRMIVDDWTRFYRRGAQPLTYIPDDGTLPVQVHIARRPEIRIGTRGSASVSVELEEQP